MYPPVSEKLMPTLRMKRVMNFKAAFARGSGAPVRSENQGVGEGWACAWAWAWACVFDEAGFRRLLEIVGTLTWLGPPRLVLRLMTSPAGKRMRTARGAKAGPGNPGQKACHQLPALSI